MRRPSYVNLKWYEYRTIPADIPGTEVPHRDLETIRLALANNASLSSSFSEPITEFDISHLT